MTTTMRLPLSTRERRCRGRQAKRDEMSVFECGYPETLAQRRLAVRGVGSDIFGAATPGLHIRLLPDDVIDAMRRERRGIPEMDGVTEAELGSLRNLARALADAQPGEEAGDDRLSAQALPARCVPVVAFEIERRGGDTKARARFGGELRPERRQRDLLHVRKIRIVVRAEIHMVEEMHGLRVRTAPELDQR